MTDTVQIIRPDLTNALLQKREVLYADGSSSFFFFFLKDGISLPGTQLSPWTGQ